MLSGWQSNNGKWYYLGNANDGSMKTGWQKIGYQGLYGNRPYWNYFDSSGAFITDSDTKGCGHGVNTFLDHKNVSTSYMRYVISNSAKNYTSSITTATARWNGMSNCHGSFRIGSTQLNSHINVTAGTAFDTNTLARTYFFVEGNTTQPENTNWVGCQIDLNSSKSISIATIAHEFGHTLGLTHRISKKTSIMCQLGQGRTATSPIQDDVNVVNHLY